MESLPDRRVVTLRVPFAPETYTISGAAADQSVVGAIARAGGFWEPEIMDVMRRFVGPADTCLDIGANVGVHTVAMAALAPAGRVHAFEPSSTNFGHLLRNVWSNGLANVTAFHLGLGEEPGRREFHYFDEYAGCSLSGGGGEDADVDAMMTRAWGVAWNRRTEAVDFLTLDAWAEANAIERVDFVKMDVEGFERHVIRGGARLFRRCRPILVTEFNRKSLQAYYGIDPRSYFDALRDIYEHFYVIPRDGNLEPVRDYDDIEARFTDAKFWLDLLCTPVPLEAGQLRASGPLGPIVVPAASLPSQAPAGSPYFASFGPYLPLDAGHYTAEFVVTGAASARDVRIDACCNHGQVLASRALADGELATTIASLEFDLPAPATDVEVRLLVPADFAGAVEQLVIVPHRSTVQAPGRRTG